MGQLLGFASLVERLCQTLETSIPLCPGQLNCDYVDRAHPGLQVKSSVCRGL